MPCMNGTFELLYEQVEPSQLLSTYSQGLSATIEVRALVGLIYGSRTKVNNHEHDRVNSHVFSKELPRACRRAIYNRYRLSPKKLKQKLYKV